MEAGSPASGIENDMSATSRRNKKTGRKTTAKPKSSVACPMCEGRDIQTIDVNQHICRDCGAEFELVVTVWVRRI